MKRVLLVVLGVLGLMAATVGISQADAGDNNDHGLCTAYFNGQKNGHGEGEDQSNQPPPFEELETTGEQYTDTDEDDNDRDTKTDEGDEDEVLTDAENIYNWCSTASTIGGNPEHGRFTCVAEGGTDDDKSDSDSDPECNENPEPGNS